jgi:hypothetical protein
MDMSGTGSFVPPDGVEMEEMDDEEVEMDDNIFIENQNQINQKGPFT